MAINKKTRQSARKALAEPGPDGCATVGEWLFACMYNLLYEGEGFSGKRPLGNSDWPHYLREAMEKHGVKDSGDLVEAIERTWKRGC